MERSHLVRHWTDSLWRTCVSTGRFAWLRILIGRQDARRPHSQDGCAPRESDAGQRQQLPKRQAEQQGGKNHENDANGLETKALSDRRNQEHSGEENGNAHVLVSRFSRFCAVLSHVCSLFCQT